MITIDGQQYDPAKLSEIARQQILSIQFVDNEIVRLQSTLAVMQMARLGYVQTLKGELAKLPSPLLPQDNGTIQFT